MASAKKSILEKGFLDGPAPHLTREDVNWRKGFLPDYDGLWAVVLDGVLTQEECDLLVAAADATTNGQWERAMVNIGYGMQKLAEDTRKCGRIIWDNRDLAAKLWKRVEAAVPEIHQLEDWPEVTGNGPVKRQEVWKVTRLNERLRFLKYTGGEYFKAHQDGCYETPDGTERSYFTLHLYLNDPDRPGQEPLQGGATSFHNWFDQRQKMEIDPKAGRVLLFQHRTLLHSGDDVVAGTKYTMRTDIMYTRKEQ